MTPARFRLALAACCALIGATGTTLVIAGSDGNSAERAGAAAALARAKQAMRFDSVARHLLHHRAMSAVTQNYQSDRSYPPFFATQVIEEVWFDPASALERTSTQTTDPGTGPAPVQMTLRDRRGAFRLTNGHTTPLPQTSLQSRYLNAWAVVADWTLADDAYLAASEKYRDYLRTVLVRHTSSGEQRLFLDPKTGFPIKLELQESHYLWGQRQIEYLYTNWILAGGVMVPGSSFRMADGQIELSRTIGDTEVIPFSPALEWVSPEESQSPPSLLPRFLQPIDPTVTQVGPHTYLLSNPGYTELVTQVGREVVLCDATQAEERASKDAAAIAKLFPGHGPLTLVVTDLAWPHIGGVRYWVANGATVVAHRAARDFLQSVIDRRWTLAPDLLERRRGHAELSFIGVDSSRPLAGGNVTVQAIDGIGSEVALMAYLTRERLLWASDYIQTVDGPSLYTSEVWRAARHAGLHPERAVAEHLPVTPWERIESLARQDEPEAAEHDLP